VSVTKSEDEVEFVELSDELLPIPVRKQSTENIYSDTYETGEDTAKN